MARVKGSTKSVNSSIDSDVSSDTNILVKLRRLKIEETLMSKNISKNCRVYPEDIDSTDPINRYGDSKNYMANLRRSYDEIKYLFEELKSNTSSQNSLNDIDIEDIKRDVLKLETKIRSIKSHLQHELKSLKTAEQVIKQQENENLLEELRRPKRMKLLSKSYKNVIPSPVKLLMNSPLKCSEVQQFQEFMMSSKNRYGGWNAFGHNIFVHLWSKYFGSTQSQDLEEEHDFDNNSHKCKDFTQEVVQKIPGITTDEVRAHIQWYSKFLYFKERQQKALDKWKVNKNIIKKSKKIDQVSDEYIEKNGSTGKDCKRQDVSLTVSDVIQAMDVFVPDRLQLECGEYFIKSSASGQSSKNQSITDQELKTYSEITDTNPDESIVQPVKKNKKQKRYDDPTEQWLNRCDDEKGAVQWPGNIAVENIKKLHIPTWRLLLQTE